MGIGQDHECDAVAVCPPFDTADARDRWEKATADAGHPGLMFMFAGFPPDDLEPEVRRCTECGTPTWAIKPYRLKLAEMKLQGCTPREICLFCAPEAVHLAIHMGQSWS